MSVETAGPSSAAAKDADLIAEIAPAMLEKLKQDGKLVGSLFAMIVVIAVSNFELSESSKAVISSVLHLSRDSMNRLGDFSFIFSLLSSFVVLPWYFERRTIKEELKYRRQRGKWRWER